jgi:hypothetical protein
VLLQNGTIYTDQGSHDLGDVIHAHCWCGSHINELLRAHAAKLPKFSAKKIVAATGLLVSYPSSK